MNSKNVLKRIVNLLSAEVTFASAKLVDGTIVESEDFAVGSEVFVVSEDGRELAPDAEHRVILDEKEFKVVTEGGVITSVEEVESEEVEAEEEEKVEEEVELSTEETTEEPSEEVALEEEVIEEEVEEEPLSLEKVYEEMKYRIEELEKKIEEMQEVKEEIKEEVKEELEEEEDLPVLDGAPVEMSRTHTKLGKKAGQSYESKFLSRLYN